MRLYYHATKPENMGSILVNGIKHSPDGFVYLADSAKNASKFGYFINDGKDVVIFSVKIFKADEDKLEETYDHSEEIFQCKAYGYSGSISKERLGAVYKSGFNPREPPPNDQKQRESPQPLRTCPYCGAHLDPGEQCDCLSKEKSAPGVATSESGNVDTQSHI